ncbi:MAG: tetratricopeptide repeat protein [Desulfovibrionales bacterium]
MEQIPTGNSRIETFGATIISFLENDSGCFIAYSDDKIFLKTLRTLLIKNLAVNSDCLFSSTNPALIMEQIKSLALKKQRIMLFVERVVNGRSTTDFVENIKTLYEDILCIVLSSEVNKGALVYLHEMGVNNFIIRPFSMNTLIEKMAMTIRPQTKIGDLIDKGKNRLQNAEFTEVLKITDMILDLKPDSAAALMLKGDAYRGLGQKDKAVEAYQEASRSAKLYLEPLLRLADFYREEGDVQAQIDYLSKLDRLSPLNVRRKVTLGGLNIEIGNMESAESYFDEAITTATREAFSAISDIAMSIAEMCAGQEPVIAEKYCRKALDIKKDMLGKSDIEIFNKLGISLRRQGKWMESITEYKRALEISPEDPSLYYNIAMAYMEGRNYPQAMENLEKALSFDTLFHENSAPIAFNIGMIFFKNEHKDKAQEFFLKCRNIDPSFKPVQKVLSAFS